MQFELIEFVSALFASLVIFATAFSYRVVSGTWASPAAAFSLFWFAFTFVPLIVLAGYPIRSSSVFYIAGCCLFFGLSSIAFDWRLANKINLRNAKHRSGYADSRFIKFVFFLSVVIGLLFVSIDVYIQGFSVQQFFAGFFATSNEFMARRYSGDIVTNMFGRWGLVCSYVAPILGGLIFAGLTVSRKRFLVLVASFLPALVIMLLQAAKGLFLLSIATFLGSIVGRRVLIGVRPYLDLSAVVPVSKGLIVVVPFVIVAFLSRGLYEAEDVSVIIEAVGRYLASYAFLHLYAFSDWFSGNFGGATINEYVYGDISYGFFSFISVFQLFGSSRVVEPGIYTEYLQLGELPAGNIYTIFRGAIMDFGLFGSFLFFLVTGALFNASFYTVLIKRRPVISLAIMLLFVQVLYTSYIISAFIWNTTFVVTGLTVIIFGANSLLAKTVPRESELRVKLT